MTNSSTLLPKLYVASSSASSCEYHRIVLPYMNIGELDLKVPILWFNRSFQHGIEKVESAKNRGAKIIMDLDDLFRLGQDHYLYDSWKQFGVTEQIIQHLKLADVVTVTTDILANMVVEVNKNVVIVPNALPFDQDQFTMNERFDDTRLIYVAGTSHQKDFELMDFNSGLTVAGLHIDNLPTKEVMPAVRYMSLYDGHQAALAPLVDTEFNRCKSNLKLLEAGAKGLPLFASKIPPYLNSNDASIIQYVEYGKSWKAMTQRYSNEHLADIGAMTAQHVRKHYHLKDANAVRRQIFESFS